MAEAFFGIGMNGVEAGMRFVLKYFKKSEPGPLPFATEHLKISPLPETVYVSYLPNLSPSLTSYLPIERIQIQLSLFSVILVKSFSRPNVPVTSASSVRIVVVFPELLSCSVDAILQGLCGRQILSPRIPCAHYRSSLGKLCSVIKHRTL